MDMSVPVVDGVFNNNDHKGNRTPGFRSHVVDTISDPATAGTGTVDAAPGRTEPTPGLRKTAKRKLAIQGSSFTVVAQQTPQQIGAAHDKDNSKARGKAKGNCASGDNNGPKDAAGCSDEHASKAKVAVSVTALTKQAISADDPTQEDNDILESVKKVFGCKDWEDNYKKKVGKPLGIDITMEELLEFKRVYNKQKSKNDHHGESDHSNPLLKDVAYAILDQKNLFFTGDDKTTQKASEPVTTHGGTIAKKSLAWNPKGVSDLFKLMVELRFLSCIGENKVERGFATIKDYERCMHSERTETDNGQAYAYPGIGCQRLKLPSKKYYDENPGTKPTSVKCVLGLYIYGLLKCDADDAQ